MTDRYDLGTAASRLTSPVTKTVPLLEFYGNSIPSDDQEILKVTE
jgi:hypothetical protein